MKGVETSMRKVLEGTKQFVIPAYQRQYSWDKKSWLGLWLPIARQYEKFSTGSTPSPYFVGSLVVHQQEGGSSSIGKFDIIDGQQRMTTIVVLLAALRDVVHGSIAEAIDEQILRNKFASESDRLKLLPKAHDGDDLSSVVLDRGSGGGRVFIAYEWFLRKVEALLDGAEDGGAALLRAVLDGLIVVEITATEGDNPHRIFQTLNSTGVGLTEVDKLRSHFFMLLPISHEKMHEKYWRPMELALPGPLLSRFIWVDTVSQGNGEETTKLDRVYEQWQLRLREVEDDEGAVVDALKDLSWRSTVFARMVQPPSNGPVDRALRRLSEWGSNVHQPLTYGVLLKFMKGQISEADAAACLAVIESFLVRRMLVAEPTNNLNRIFTTTVGQVASDVERLPAVLRSVLSEKGKYWPTDGQVRDAALSAPFATTQRTAQRHFVLKRIEEKLAVDGHINWDSARFSLEHFMPQNLTAEWFSALRLAGSEDPAESHRQLVHTIGNVTLTSLNSKLSDSPHERKKALLMSSKLAISEALNTTDSWGPDEIRARSIWLADVAIELWPGPVDEDDFDQGDDLGVVEEALAALVDSEWTSVSHLADLAGGADERVVVDYLNERLVGERRRVLTQEGLPDVRLAWVSSNIAGFRAELVDSGVFESIRSESAQPESFVSATQMAERIS